MIWIGKGYIEKVYDKVIMIQLSFDKLGIKVIIKERQVIVDWNCMMLDQKVFKICVKIRVYIDVRLL